MAGAGYIGGRGERRLRGRNRIVILKKSVGNSKLFTNLTGGGRGGGELRPGVEASLADHCNLLRRVRPQMLQGR